MDIYHVIGNDLQLNASNDLAFVFDTDETNQRIMRRLFTNKGTYIWNPTWGASIPWTIGETLSVAAYKQIVNDVTAAVLEDKDVAQDPAPEITLDTTDNGLICFIRYYNTSSDKHDTISFKVT